MKKLIYISAISFLLVSMASCYTKKTLTSLEEFNKNMNKSNSSSEFNKKVKVLLVVTKQGDSVSFTKKTPGRIFAKEVAVLTQGHLSFDEIDSAVFNKHSAYFETTIQSIWMNGKQYELIRKDESGFIYPDSVSFRIPLSEIELMKVRKFQVWATTGMIAGAVSAGLVIGIIISLAISPMMY
jgi:hypothetical protein